MAIVQRGLGGLLEAKGEIVVGLHFDVEESGLKCGVLSVFKTVLLMGDFTK